METWAIVTIVLGTSLITNLLTWFLTNRQLTHSDKRLEKQLQAQREADEHKRRWDARSQPLMKLSTELANMVEKWEAIVDFTVQIIDGVTPFPDSTRKDLKKAVEEWNAYIGSGEFYQACHMQYDNKLKVAANDIFLNYQSTYLDIRPFLEGGKAVEKIGEAREVMKENSARISEIQLRIYELLEEL